MWACAWASSIIESTREAAATGEKKLEEVVGQLSKAKGQLEEAASSLAALTTEKNAAEASKQKLEAENADLMNVGADALTEDSSWRSSRSDAFSQIWTSHSAAFITKW